MESKVTISLKNVRLRCGDTVEDINVEVHGNENTPEKMVRAWCDGVTANDASVTTKTD